ncbi:MAG: Gfo/Idh/MocA family oxidoreductase [Methylococcales bacterium]
MIDENSNSNLIRWGIIGCGNVTEVKSGPAYQKVEGFQLAAVMRRNLEKAQDYAKRHGVERFYSKAEDIINNDAIDAVYIATPPDSHKHYALKVAAAGKPCCIEKPLSPNYPDSLAIYEAFKDQNLPLFVAYYRRSLPRFNLIKTWLENDEIGAIRHIRWHLSKPASQVDLSRQYNWRTDTEIASGGYFDDLASHGLDLFTYLLGNIQQAQGISINQQSLYSAKDAVAANWLHKSGATGTGSWNFGCSGREDNVEIFGSKGKIEFSVFDEEPLVLKNNNGERSLFVKHPENIQLYHVQDMRDQLLGNKRHPSDGLSATHTSWFMDKILGKI